jgi:alkylhydroperoxidase family enzyme
MPRLAPLEPPYAVETAEVLASMMPPGVEPLRLFRTLARNPRVLRKIRDGNLLDRGSIERRDREIAILRSCARCGAEYEWGVHVALFARRLGLSEAQIRATRTGAPEDPSWSTRDRLIVELADALHDESRVPAPLWKALEEVFAAEQLVELVVLIGFYHTISFVVNAFEIELEAGAERFPVGPAAPAFA